MTRLLRLALPAVFLIALVAPLMAGVATVSAATKSIDAWIDISATRPEVGCVMDISVEVRESGRALPSVEVELALHVADTIVALDRAITNENGIAFLELDTSDADAGVGHWLDINMGGEYLTGLSIVPSADGGCTNAHKLLSVEGDINYVPASASSESGSGAEVKVSVPRYCSATNRFPVNTPRCTLRRAHSVTAFPNTRLTTMSAGPPTLTLGIVATSTASGGEPTTTVYTTNRCHGRLPSFGFNGDAFYAVGDSGALTNRLDQGTPVSGLARTVGR